eukprot:1249639-Alexandrium_andersonii.AAC.1
MTCNSNRKHDYNRDRESRGNRDKEPLRSAIRASPCHWRAGAQTARSQTLWPKLANQGGAR